MSDYVKTHRFQEKLKSLKSKLSKEFSDTIAKNPGHIRILILQILNTYPDILDDKSGPILEYIKTDVGNIPIIQPLYELSENQTPATLILIIKMKIYNRWNQILMIASFKRLFHLQKT